MKININNAPPEELTRVLSPVISTEVLQKILSARSAGTRFEIGPDLTQLRGIGRPTALSIARFVSFGAADQPRVILALGPHEPPDWGSVDRAEQARMNAEADVRTYDFLRTVFAEIHPRLPLIMVQELVPFISHGPILHGIYSTLESASGIFGPGSIISQICSGALYAGFDAELRSMYSEQAAAVRKEGQRDFSQNGARTQEFLTRESSVRGIKRIMERCTYEAWFQTSRSLELWSQANLQVQSRNHAAALATAWASLNALTESMIMRDDGVAGIAQQMLPPEEFGAILIPRGYCHAKILKNALRRRGISFTEIYAEGFDDRMSVEAEFEEAGMPAFETAAGRTMAMRWVLFYLVSPLGDTLSGLETFEAGRQRERFAIDCPPDAVHAWWDEAVATSTSLLDAIERTKHFFAEVVAGAAG